MTKRHKETFVLEIGPDGVVSCICTPEFDDLLGEGTVRKRRVSHVEPISRVLRWLFHAIRSRVSDTGKLAAWTRVWPCAWRANLAPVDGPTLGPYSLRVQAINAEIDWLHTHLFRLGDDRLFGIVEITNDYH